MKRHVLLLAALAVVAAGPAAAHRLSPAYFGLAETAPGEFDARWKVSISGGLADALEPDVPEVCEIARPVRTYTIDDARLQIGGLRCEAGLAGSRFGVRGLEATDTDVLLRVDYLDGRAFNHRLVPESASVEIPEPEGAGEVAATYLVIGVEHILLGPDHLLFVLALLLLVRGIGRLVATVTAFTIAHSITLGAATLGIVQVPSTPVEAVIALSILFLATELARRGTAPPGARQEDLAERFPWLVAFTFGLLHGFGFAGALSEVGLPEGAIPLALLFFNVGVEVGQLLFVAAFVAAAAALRRLSVPAPVWTRQAAVYAIGITSSYWLLERTVPVF